MQNTRGCVIEALVVSAAAVVNRLEEVQAVPPPPDLWVVVFLTMVGWGKNTLFDALAAHPELRQSLLDQVRSPHTQHTHTHTHTMLRLWSASSHTHTGCTSC